MGKDKSISETMTLHLREIAEERRARLQAKLDNGYRPRLDSQGNVVLVKVKARERQRMRSVTDQLLTGMPAPDISKLKLGTDAGYYAREITKPDGTLYASKPKSASPEGRYIWRMVVYMVSPRTQHQCMPVTAHFELGPYSKVKDLLDELDAIADQIINSIPVHQWHGIKRWGRVLGGYI